MESTGQRHGLFGSKRGTNIMLDTGQLLCYSEMLPFCLRQLSLPLQNQLKLTNVTNVIPCSDVSKLLITHPNISIRILSRKDNVNNLNKLSATIMVVIENNFNNFQTLTKKELMYGNVTSPIARC